MILGKVGVPLDEFPAHEHMVDGRGHLLTFHLHFRSFSDSWLLDGKSPLASGRNTGHTGTRGTLLTWVFCFVLI